MARLALETSTALGSLALDEEGRLLAECTLSVRATHSETILPEVERLADRAGVAPTALEAIVVGAGPGSFTGVRIAAALAKGLCFGIRAPLYAYSSLAAVAAGAAPGPVCALFDARRGEVYAAAFEPEAGPEPVFGPEALAVATLLDRLGEPGRWRFAGEGARRHRQALEAAGASVLPAHLGVPRAASLLWLAERWPGAGRVEDPAAWEPLYVRAPGAQRQAERAAGFA